MTLLKTVYNSRFIYIAYLVITVSLSLIFMYISSALPLRENTDHAASHLSIAIPIALLAVLILHKRRKLVSSKRISGKKLIAVGLGVIALGLVTEAVGAFGYDGNSVRIQILSSLHNSSLLVVFAGMFLVLIGVLIAIRHYD